MTAINKRELLIKEIESMPEAALSDLEKFLADEKRKRGERVARLKSLAGAWSDWDDAEFDAFMKEMQDARERSATESLRRNDALSA